MSDPLWGVDISPPSQLPAKVTDLASPRSCGRAGISPARVARPQRSYMCAEPRSSPRGTSALDVEALGTPRPSLGRVITPSHEPSRPGLADRQHLLTRI